MKKLLYLLPIFLISCQKEIKIDFPTGGENPIVVEAYINTAYPELNYVLLSKSKDYGDNNTEIVPVKGASVSITAGTKATDGAYIWDESSTKSLTETAIPNFITANLGFYADPTLTLLGQEEKYYRLVIDADGKKDTSFTYIPKMVVLDSISYEKKTDGAKEYAQITIHYNDLPERGERYMDMYDTTSVAMPRGWADVATYRLHDDITINGVYRNELRFTRYSLGDTLSYYLISISEPSYDFWKGIDANQGTPNPFSGMYPIPFTVKSKDFIGGFTGMAVSKKVVILE